jgi:30S ribosomal protein S31
MLERYVGKGDRRTRRGKIYAGSFGKSRPKDPKARGTASSTASAKSAVKTEPKKPAARPAPKRAAK